MAKGVSLKGIHLRLFINGRKIGRNVVDTLQSANVRTSSNGATAFQLEFSLMNHSKIHNQLTFAGQKTRRETRIAIMVLLNTRQIVLVDGVVTNHQLNPGARPGMTRLTLTGEDLTRVMDYEERDGRQFPNLSLAARVRKILSEYSSYRISPMVEEEKHRDVEPRSVRVPHQRGTDLDYIRSMAQLAGHVFCLESDGLERVIAYWGPEFSKRETLPALSVDLGVATNVTSMNFTFDSEKGEDPIVQTVNKLDRTIKNIGLGNQFDLNEQLGKRIAEVKRRTKLRGTAKFSDARSKLAGLAVKASSANALSATGSVDTLRYGAILKPRRRVDVRGATEAFNGTWMVQSVTHQISRGVYHQDFKLVRNALDMTSNLSLIHI